MQQRTEFALLMLQQIGIPLLQSLSGEQGADPAKEAAQLAALLGRSAEYGAQIEKTLDILPQDKKSRSLRIALTALGAQAVAIHGKQEGRPPSDNEAKRIAAAFEPVIALSDEFTPDEEAITRLRGLSADFALLDGQQLQLQQIMAFLPVLQAISAFSFGQTEAKLVKEVAQRLVSWSSAFRERILGSGLDADEEKIIDLVFVRMLAPLYADCHRAQTKRLMKLEEGARAAVGTDTVWKDFESRASMLETLAGTFLPAPKPKPIEEFDWDNLPSSPLPERGEDDEDEDYEEQSSRGGY